MLEINVWESYGWNAYTRARTHARTHTTNTYVHRSCSLGNCTLHLKQWKSLRTKICSEQCCSRRNFLVRGPWVSEGRYVRESIHRLGARGRHHMNITIPKGGWDFRQFHFETAFALTTKMEDKSTTYFYTPFALLVLPVPSTSHWAVPSASPYPTYLPKSSACADLPR